MDNAVSVVVNGQTLTGWTDVRITLRCEGLPNDFELGLTGQNPSDGSQVVAYAGQTCTVSIGDTQVISGYVDRDTNEGDARRHRMGIVGRGRCADLVDCSAEWSGGQISGSDALQVASKLAQPYGISCSLAPGQTSVALKPIPQFNLNYGETAQQIIDRVCTYDGLLYYEDSNGDLVLSRVGATAAASGFVYGQNVLAWSVTNSMDQRFSNYVCAQVSVDIFGDLGNGSQLTSVATDPNVPRHRALYLVAEAVSNSLQLCQQRARWECARRAGRGTSASITGDSWRDSGGTLWTPNTLVPVTLPGLRLSPPTQLCLSEVSFLYDLETGTRVEAVLMPPDAFQVQPIQIQPNPFAQGELTQ